ncbi:MAG: hypothetical protein ACYDBP_13290 [Leptospirales bacterium]
MGYKRMDVRVTDKTLSAVKKRAVSEGKSASEIARELIEVGLENRTGGEVALSGRGPGMDLEMLKTAIDQERSEYKETQRELARMGLLPDAPDESGLSPRIIKFQVEALIKTYELLRKMSLFLEPDEHKKRIDYAEKIAMEDAEKLILGGEK